MCVLLPTLSTADAVGNDAAGLFVALRAAGIEAHLLAERWSPDVEWPVEPLTRYDAYATQPGTVTIYHHGLFSADSSARFLRSAGPKVLRYHNVTPPEFFAPYSEELTAMTRHGRAQTRLFVTSRRIDLFLADSAYNARELTRLGAPTAQCKILSPFRAVEPPNPSRPSMPLLERYLDGFCNVLFVGRLAPNKGHRHLLGVLAAYRRRFRRAVRLFIVGGLDPRLSAYQAELQALAQGLRVSDAVVWTGRVSAEELRTYWLLAHAFLVMSEHEGFCVPAVEAMERGVPVVAYGATALSETVGDAGIVLQGLDYDHYAAALELLFTRDDHREPLTQHARRRAAQEFSPAALSHRFEQYLSPLLAAA